MRKTVNLSRVKASPRQKRAGKAVKLLKEAFDSDIKISPELNEQIWRKGIQSPPNKVIVEEENETLYPVEEPGQKQETVEKSAEEEYSEIVDGNIGDIKDEVNELENPDFEALIEAEEEGKDRKTLKEWFESQK
jgi:ribosomal protein L31E